MNLSVFCTRSSLLVRQPLYVVANCVRAYSTCFRLRFSYLIRRSTLRLLSHVMKCKCLLYFVLFSTFVEDVRSCPLSDKLLYLLNSCILTKLTHM